jgi:hypothetical protein
MSSTPMQILRHRAVNDWNLFWLVAGPTSVAMLIAMLNTDLTSGEGVSSMIQLSVRCAVPLLYITFAASAVLTLFPGNVSRWLFRNRKYFGLAFAAAMAWQGFFIVWLVTIHAEYYLQEVYVLRDAIEGATGYLFLAAMTVTSFRVTRRHMSPAAWRLLHFCGIYFLWAYAFSVYWWALFYYRDPGLLDHCYYWAGFLAWGLRAAAWSSKRLNSVRSVERASGVQPVLWLLGVAVAAPGLLAVTFGTPWRQLAEEHLYGYMATRIPELYLPYWPFEPFLPLLVVALGVGLIWKARA